MTVAFEPKTTALLVMDVQSAIVDIVADKKEPLLRRTAALIDAGRAAGARIIYVVLGFRPGHPEIGPGSGVFTAVRQSGRFVEGSAGSEIHPAVSPRAGDIVVTKHRVGAFMGTDLELILRANRIETLVLCGIATSGIVLSTLRHASDADYRLIVAQDCCTDPDDEVHRVLMEKVFPKQAKVLTGAEVFAA